MGGGGEGRKPRRWRLGTSFGIRKEFRWELEDDGEDACGLLPAWLM
jgi:hypothetical protein